MRSLSTGTTGMLAQQLNVEVISNNIANMNTTGYKAQRAEFADLLYQNLERPGAATSSTGTIVPYGIQIGLGVKQTGVHRVTEQGNLNFTENPYDLAIQGRGCRRRERGLTDAGFSFEKQRTLERQREIERNGEAVVGNVSKRSSSE